MPRKKQKRRPPAHYNPPPKFGLRIPYGLWDIETKTWLGDDRGPVVYFEPEIAAVAATVLSIRFRARLVMAIHQPGNTRRRPDDYVQVMTIEDSWAVAEGHMSEPKARRRFHPDAVYE